MQFDCSGLSEEWDQNEDIRSRLRNGLGLVRDVAKSKDSTIAQCTANSDVLHPALHKLFAAGLKLPEIDRLREECARTYAKASKTPEADTVDDDAWELRKMCRFVKRKANREEVSQEPTSCFGFKRFPFFVPVSCTMCFVPPYNHKSLKA